MKMDNFENTNHLVLNFYPDGYSLAFKLNEFPVFTSETILETAKISYEEMSLLDYIENEELPPLLVEMIDASPKLSQYKIWHNGCLILEIRDKISYRKSKNCNKGTNGVAGHDTQTQTPKPDTNGFSSHSTNQNIDKEHHDDSESGKGSYFIILKPSNLSMINDVQNLTDSDTWSTREKLQLESKIILHSSPQLFLDPLRDTEDESHPDRDNHWPYKKPTNAYTRLKNKLPHPRIANHQDNYHDQHQDPSDHTSLHKNQANYIVDNLPPELTLQHFLATKRATRKKLSPSQTPRFHRFRHRS